MLGDLLRPGFGDITQVIVGEIDHGLLQGLADDDHTQYLLVDGTRPLTANWDAGNYTITANGLTIDGTFTDGTMSIASGSITSGVSGTFSQTLQAEHLYSTDDLQVDDEALIDGRIIVGGGDPQAHDLLTNGSFRQGSTGWSAQSDWSLQMVKLLGHLLEVAVGHKTCHKVMLLQLRQENLIQLNLGCRISI